MKVFRFAAGMAVGYVLGSRAGRDKYEQIVAAARKAQHHPAVTQAQQKAKEMLGTPAGSPPIVDSDSPVPVARRQPNRTTTTVEPLA